VAQARGLIAVDKVGNKVRFYDPETIEEIKSFDSPEPAAHELALSHDGALAFVPLYGDGIYGNNKHPNNKILVVDLDRQALRDVIDLGEYLAPHGMATTRDGKLWVTCDVANKLLLVDPVTKAIEAVYDSPGKGAHQMTILPDESKLYLSNKESAVGVFDLRRREFCAEIPIGRLGVTKGNGSGGEGLTPTPDGRGLLVADNDRSDIRVIDTAADREIDRVPMVMNALSNAKRSRLMKLMFSRDTRHLVVTSYASGLAWIVDAADYRRQTLIPVAKGPQGMAFSPDGRTVLVSSHDSGLLTQIDLETCQVLGAFDGGAGIEVLAYY
jgi:DNA-binding beta-propeller fold protein YncE